MELFSCPNEANAVTKYTEMGVSVEDIVEHQQILEGRDK